MKGDHDVSKDENIVQQELNERSQELFGKNKSQLEIGEREKLYKYIHDIYHPVWKPIIIDGIKSQYMINKFGDIVNGDTNYKLSQNTSEFGYKRVNLNINGKVYYWKVHRLVAMTFIPNPENKREVNHINCNKTCNWVENLEWVTPTENKQHAIEHGLYDNASFYKKGEARSQATHSDKQAHVVCKMLEAGKFPKEIAETLNVSISFVNAIKYRGKWAHISCQYNIPKPYQYNTAKTRQIIVDCINNGETDVVIILTRAGLPITKPNRKYATSIKFSMKK